MNIERIKEMLKNKKVIVASSVISLVVIGAIAGIVVHNKNKVEDNKHIVETNKENDNIEEKEAKNKLEELKKIDISKLPEEDKKALESKIAAIEKLIENKEYAKATTDIESLKKDVNTKIEEVAKNEEIKKEEENKDESNKEVASSITENNTSSSVVNTESSTSSNTSSNTNNAGSGSSSSGSTQGSVQDPKPQPPVTEKPVQPTPTPPVEPPKPVYPSVEEVKQRLIAYGQSLGLKYDPSISGATEGVMMQGSEQMWSSERGNSPDQWIVTGLNSSGCYAFNVDVVDLGNGFCSMKAYGIMNWD